MHQEIMLALCRAIGSFKGKSSFYTWFKRLVWNKIADYYRRDCQNKEILMNEGVDIDNMRTSQIEWCSIYDDVVAILPEQYRSVLLKSYSLGMSYSEIAVEEKKEYEAIRGMQRRALEYIRISFTENELR